MLFLYVPAAGRGSWAPGKGKATQCRGLDPSPHAGKRSLSADQKPHCPVTWWTCLLQRLTSLHLARMRGGFTVRRCRPCGPGSRATRGLLAMSTVDRGHTLFCIKSCAGHASKQEELPLCQGAWMLGAWGRGWAHMISRHSLPSAALCAERHHHRRHLAVGLLG